MNRKYNTFFTLTPCTGENDPIGSSLKKNKIMGSKTVPIWVQNLQSPEILNLKAQFLNHFCWFFFSLMNPKGRFLLYRVQGMICSLLMNSTATLHVIFTCRKY